MTSKLAAALILLTAEAAWAGEKYAVDPAAGKNNFSAVFDAPLGERINAVSSEVGCDLEVSGQSAKGHCSVPLKSIKVDSDDTKTEHFQQWSTNKKVEPDACRFELSLDDVKLSGPLKAKAAVPFTASGSFKICGRSRTGGGSETITGSAMLFPAGSYGTSQTLRIRATIDTFDRESYGISPKNTEGWLARVQQLAPVVSAQGKVDVSLFAKLEH